jgi:hypothetical protein
MKDKIGFEIPAHLAETWNEADKVGRELCGQIQRLYLMIEKRLAAHDPIFAEINQNTVIDLKNAWRTLQQIIPYAVCPYDEGEIGRRENCLACYSKGYLSKFRWDRCVPKQIKGAHLTYIRLGHPLGDEIR